MLSEGHCPGLSEWTQCNHKCSHMREAGGPKSKREGDGEAEVEVMYCDDGRRTRRSGMQL